MDSAAYTAEMLAVSNAVGIELDAAKASLKSHSENQATLKMALMTVKMAWVERFKKLGGPENESLSDYDSSEEEEEAEKKMEARPGSLGFMSSHDL